LIRHFPEFFSQACLCAGFVAFWPEQRRNLPQMSRNYRVITIGGFPWPNQDETLSEQSAYGSRFKRTGFATMRIGHFRHMGVVLDSALIHKEFP